MKIKLLFLFALVLLALLLVLQVESARKEEPRPTVPRKDRQGSEPTSLSRERERAARESGRDRSRDRGRDRSPRDRNSPKCRLDCGHHGRPLPKNPKAPVAPLSLRDVPEWCQGTPITNCCFQFFDCQRRCGMEKTMCEDRFDRCASSLCERQSDKAGCQDTKDRVGRKILEISTCDSFLQLQNEHCTCPSNDEL